MTGAPPPPPALTEPVTIAGRAAPSRVVFGPHETNLGRRRALSDRHVAYYARRAAGGAGVVVTETASAHASDWPYERAPLAADCGPGWRAVRDACRPHGALVLAGIGHTGSQGSSAWSQSALWAPSRVPDVASRELPMAMEADDVAAVIEGFAAAAALAAECDLDGVEVDAGAQSLLRQFLSGLTNQRSDAYGDAGGAGGGGGGGRTRLLREVLTAVRSAIGAGRVLALRLSCDELAPWAGVTPEAAAVIAAEVAPLVDVLIVVRGSAMSGSANRPDLHVPPQFNTDLCRAIRDAVHAAADGHADGSPGKGGTGAPLVVLQGSVVDVGAAAAALADGTADLVEMTRAQIAEPDLVAHARRGAPERARPCVLSNQRCRVRDNRNPIVSCLGEPGAGHEVDEPFVFERATAPLGVTVVGAGPAGLEAARVLALAGHDVELLDRADRTGGALRLAAGLPGRERLARLVDWLDAEVRLLGVTVRLGHEAPPPGPAAGRHVIVATGSVDGPLAYDVADGATVVQVHELLRRLAAGDGVDDVLPAGPVLVADPVGDWTGAATAELLAAAGRATAIVSQDPVIGTQLALTGDLADANARLARADVRRVLRSAVTAVDTGTVHVRHVLTAVDGVIEAAAVVHCGHRLPAPAPPGLDGPGGADSGAAGLVLAGDCVAPRTAHEAILDGRRAALALTRGSATRGATSLAVV